MKYATKGTVGKLLVSALVMTSLAGFSNKKDPFSYKTPAPIVKLKDAALKEGKMDSLKTQVLKADEKGRLDIGNGRILYAEPNAKIIKVPPKTDGKIEPKQTDDPRYGLQPKTANAFLSTGTGTNTYVSGNLTVENYQYNPVQTFSAYVNGVSVFQQGQYFSFPCDFHLMPEWNAVKSTKFTYYLTINLPPLDTTNYGATAQLIRYFMQCQGAPPEVYNANMFFNMARGPPLYQLPTKWIAEAFMNLDSLGHITNVGGSPVIYSVGLCDGYIVPPGNANKTIGGIATPVSIVYNYGNGNHKFNMGVGLVGACTGTDWTPLHPGFLVYETVSINPIITQVPVNYTLSQNYPNPFNSSTKIKFDVVKPGNVSIKVYSIVGKKIESIVDKKMEPGTYEATWNANVSSGVYFYTMTAGSFTETKKMVVVK